MHAVNADWADVVAETITDAGMPLMIRPRIPGVSVEDFRSLLAANRGLLKRALLEHGAVLLRDFPVHTVDDFLLAVQGLELGAFVDYSGGDSPRTHVKGYAYTSTDAPPFMRIPLHQEMSFARDFPRHICFYCDTVPASGGETIIGDARRIYQALDETVRRRFEEAGVWYVSQFYGRSRALDFINRFQKIHKSWMDGFETTDKAVVEEKCRRMGCEFRWTGGDWLRIERKRPASIEHPETRQRVWFNQVHLFEFTPRFVGWRRYLATRALYPRDRLYVQAMLGDGSRIRQSCINELLDVLDQHAVHFPWRKGDVLVLDNILAMHGRAAFTGDRRVLVAMTR